jgi:hypothetical protein
MAPDALPSTLPLDWQAEVMGFVARSCREGIAAERDWLGLPPALLSGGCVDERLHVGRQIATHGGLPHFVWRLCDGEDPCGMGDVALPPPPMLAMVASRCANPVVSVVGVDRADARRVRMLAEVIDPRSGSRRTDAASAAAFDFSRVSWLIGVDPGTFAPRGVERLCERVVLRPIEEAFEPLVRVSMIDRAISDLGLAGRAASLAPLSASSDARSRRAREGGSGFGAAQSRVLAEVAAAAGMDPARGGPRPSGRMPAEDGTMDDPRDRIGGTRAEACRAPWSAVAAGMIGIVVNGRRHAVASCALDHAEVVRLAGTGGGSDCVVAWRNGPKEAPEGLLAPGDELAVVEETAFDVAAAFRS